MATADACVAGGVAAGVGVAGPPKTPAPMSVTSMVKITMRPMGAMGFLRKRVQMVSGSGRMTVGFTGGRPGGSVRLRATGLLLLFGT